MRILGISKVSESGRIFVPKDVKAELDVGSGYSFAVEEKRVVLVPSQGGRVLDERGRLYLSKEVRKKLSIDVGSDIIFLKNDDGKILISKLEDVRVQP